MSELLYLPDVVTLALNVDRCNGCRNCVDVCPHDVFAIENKRAVIVHRDACMECGACSMNCEPGAIVVVPGVGCAYGIMLGYFLGTGPTCGGDGVDASCCG